MVNETNIIVNQTAITGLSQPVGSINLVVANEAVDNLITEGGEDFYNYVNRIGLAKDPNLIVLSSRHSYFYDTEELNNAKTVINLKELNQIKQIKSLLHFLPQSCNFVGCFVNNNTIERYALRKSSSSIDDKKSTDYLENGIVSQYPFINMLYSIMDFKTNTYMSRSSVALLLEDYGFKVIDMTEYNGLTYFYSKKIGDIYN